MHFLTLVSRNITVQPGTNGLHTTCDNHERFHHSSEHLKDDLRHFVLVSIRYVFHNAEFAIIDGLHHFTTSLIVSLLSYLYFPLTLLQSHGHCNFACFTYMKANKYSRACYPSDIQFPMQNRCVKKFCYHAQLRGPHVSACI